MGGGGPPSNTGFGANSKAPRKASRISKIMSSPNEVLAKDKNLTDYYDDKNFYEKADANYGFGTKTGSGGYRCRALYDVIINHHSFSLLSQFFYLMIFLISC